MRRPTPSALLAVMLFALVGCSGPTIDANSCAKATLGVVWTGNSGESTIELADGNGVIAPVSFQVSDLAFATELPDGRQAFAAAKEGDAESTVVTFDPATCTTSKRNVPQHVRGYLESGDRKLAFGQQGDDGMVFLLDEDDSPVAQRSLGGLKPATAVEVSDGFIVVANSLSGQESKALLLSKESLQPIREAHLGSVGSRVTSVVLAGGKVWVGVAQPAQGAPQVGVLSADLRHVEAVRLREGNEATTLRARGDKVFVLHTDPNAAWSRANAYRAIDVIDAKTNAVLLRSGAEHNLVEARVTQDRLWTVELERDGVYHLTSYDVGTLKPLSDTQLRPPERSQGMTPKYLIMRRK